LVIFETQAPLVTLLVEPPATQNAEYLTSYKRYFYLKRCFYKKIAFIKQRYWMQPHQKFKIKSKNDGLLTWNVDWLNGI